MPFRHPNAPVTLQRALDIALALYKWKTCLVYIDDVVIFSRTIGSHIKHVYEILVALADAGMSLKWKKCEFFRRCIKYLGHLISPGCLDIDSIMTKSLR